MTDIKIHKKLNKYKERVYELLDKHRCNEESSDKATHLSYGGIFSGKFFLDKDVQKQFMDLYVKAIDNGVNDFSILERHKEYGPIIIDIDLEIPIENYKGGRLYDTDMILNIGKKYISSIKMFLEVDNSKTNFMVFEKNKPSEKEYTIKDGFHMVFQDLCVQTKMRHLIRNKVVELCEKESTFENFSGDANKIIDKAVVSSNAWFLYGGKKPNGQSYKLSYIYNHNLLPEYDHENGIMYDYDTGEQFEKSYDNETLIRYLSIRSVLFNKKKMTPVQDMFNDSDIDAECEKLGINSTLRSEQIKYEVPIFKEDEIRKARKFTSMLDRKRSLDYHDWMKVGFALHNIDNCLLDTWIEFSRLGSKKFKEGECEKIWRSMKNPLNGNVLTIRSLAFWAKHDNPKEYEAFIKEDFKNMMKKSLDGNIYHLAKSVHAKYSDKFVCSSIKNNIWWEFKHHRWYKIEEGYTLKVLFSEDFANEYNREIVEISVKATQTSGVDKEELQSRRMKIDKIVEKLMNTTFKNTLLSECTTLFFDSSFEQKLDSNINLIGFENGIYDLETGEFRDGRPDDYITLSTHNDYYKWSEKNPYNNQIFKFFEQVLPNKSVREYFLNALCTCLSGNTKEEKLYILTGCGSNGKSLTMDLMSAALGQYYMSCPITIITKKRGQSNETSPEKVRMKGRRCGVFQETDDGEKMNVGVMKEFTGGDKILVRDLFKGADQMIEFKPQMKYFLTCNQMPTVPSNDEGTWRRLRVILFGSKFTDNPTKFNEFPIDKTLKQKIEQWAPTFISYLIHIYNTEYKNKTNLIDPPEVMASTKQYKLENDFYTEYIIDNINVVDNPNKKIEKTQLYENFKCWYKLVYNDKTIPKRPEFLKFINTQFGEPNTNGYYSNVEYRLKQGSEDDGQKCDLDC